MPPTLLQQRDRARIERRRQLYEETRRKLRSALAELLPKHRVILFGSLTRRGVFNDASDVDLALETEPANISVARLSAELSERLGRPVDIVLLGRVRFGDRIHREGEAWIC
ncbi:MAG: nucleotidyltransferase domain-containing protein [Acidobacteria bacterium]|nr:nucleotidyltransferase domain-containing protein [Acidobacteriota bacterium]